MITVPKVAHNERCAAPETGDRSGVWGQETLAQPVVRRLAHSDAEWDAIACRLTETIARPTSGVRQADAPWDAPKR